MEAWYWLKMTSSTIPWLSQSSAVVGNTAVGQTTLLRILSGKYMSSVEKGDAHADTVVEYQHIKKTNGSTQSLTVRENVTA